VQDATNTQRTPYLFTGKELDEETGLYYFGARYYDPRTGVWQSTDRILDDYLAAPGDDHSGLPGIGGVYNSKNLALYGYAHQNPISYKDPDGNVVFLAAPFGYAVVGLNR
jgi:RHS repeat-associated protein